VGLDFFFSENIEMIWCTSILKLTFLLRVQPISGSQVKPHLKTKLVNNTLTYQAYCTSPSSDKGIQNIDRIITDKENKNTQRKTCSNATLSTTNPTRTILELNSGLHGGKRYLKT
jgi:hypothetical protein